MRQDWTPMNRRQFLVSSAVMLGAATIKVSPQAKKRPLGVQLYTVRKQARKHLPAVLASIREIGYEEIETYWDVYSRPAAELKRLINDHGLRVPSGHFNYDGLEAKLDYAATLGVGYIICPMLPKTMQISLDGFKQAADQFNKWGEKIKGMGLRFGFHNHNYEFRKLGNITGFEVLMSRTDPSLMCLEMDCYWITQAGHDPLEMLKTYGSRIQLLHLKDRKPGFPTSQKLDKRAEHFTPAGTGTINWKSILPAAQQNGIEHMFVEQDSSDIPPIESVRIAYKNLQPLL
jgi:sugar phosphate isomerase/epimerase